jgi:hypothetical protein
MVDLLFIIFVGMNFLEANIVYKSRYKIWFHVIYKVILSM